jgi:hypothetical protein
VQFLAPIFVHTTGAGAGAGAGAAATASAACVASVAAFLRGISVISFSKCRQLRGARVGERGRGIILRRREASV